MSKNSQFLRKKVPVKDGITSKPGTASTPEQFALKKAARREALEERRRQRKMKKKYK